MARTKPTTAAVKKRVVETPIISRDDEKKAMYAAAKAGIEQSGSDEVLDKENEKRFLAEFKRYNPTLARIIGELKAYAKTFPKEFYEQIYRLHSWSTEPESLRNRPGIVGAWTIEFIYNRFPDGTVPVLRSRNPRTAAGELMFKHFQLLTEEGELLLKQYIQEATLWMSQCSSWSQFKNLFARNTGKTYQTFMFANDAV